MILNVDDHEPGRYARSRLLKQAGFEVTDAANGTQALALAGALRPSLIMLDVNLPDMSGLEVCRQIKADALLSSTPILQISASAISPEERAGGLDNGADAYLVAPIHFDVLVATIRALLRMRKAEAALADANLELRRTNEDLQNFAHAASHDLKEPLRSISCFAGLLEKRYRGRLDREGDLMLTNIQKGAARMTTLIEGLLVYAQAGQLTSDDWEDVDLSRVVVCALKNLEQSIMESGATIICDPLPTVRGNEASLSQLFQNLIHNALKYHKANQPSHIAITTAGKAANMVEIAVADDGVGIPAEHQSSIFAPFQRLHGSEIPGFGIGLATCRRIVERHGGEIKVKSDGVGAGSTFYLLLPAK